MNEKGNNNTDTKIPRYDLLDKDAIRLENFCQSELIQRCRALEDLCYHLQSEVDKVKRDLAQFKPMTWCPKCDKRVKVKQKLHCRICSECNLVIN